MTESGKLTITYEDLAGRNAFDGILNHDDALLRQKMPVPAITAYQQAGLLGEVDEFEQRRTSTNRWVL